MSAASWVCEPSPPAHRELHLVPRSPVAILKFVILSQQGAQHVHVALCPAKPIVWFCASGGESAKLAYNRTRWMTVPSFTRGLTCGLEDEDKIEKLGS